MDLCVRRVSSVNRVVENLVALGNAGARDLKGRPYSTEIKAHCVFETLGHFFYSAQYG